VTGGAGQHHQQARHGGVTAGVRGDHGDAGRGHQQGQQLQRAHPLAVGQQRQPDGEEHLRLHHQRGHAGRDAAGQRQVQQPELPGPDQHAVGRQQPPAHRRPRDEQAGRQQRQGEAQHAQQQRR
jgi:hypothetical protein